MDLRKSSITADILNILSDGQNHTMQDIADEIDVSRKTVVRHIQSLSFRYPIQTFCGGINRGGVYLDKKYIYQGQPLTYDELQVINKALTLLQESKCEDVNYVVLKCLFDRFTPPNNKEQIDERKRNEICG